METYDEAEHFQCIICLELVYKPIVHACGHLFCFWCVHHAMDGACKNLCPLCRRPYMHFPRICEQLHFVLLKAVHDKYLIRAKEVQEEEDQRGIFSPEFHDEPSQSRSRPLDIERHETPPGATSKVASSTDTPTVSSSNQSSERGSVCNSKSSSTNGVDPSSIQETDLVSLKGKAPMADEGVTNREVQEFLTEAEDLDTSISNLIVAASDLTCLHCCNLLYRPVVLNCGHMFCEHCVVVSEDESVSCPSCKAEHPGMFPQVCLELHHYIDRIFPLEYAQRSLEVACEEQERPSNRPQLPASVPEVSIKGSIRRSFPGPVHRAVGCDGCGMMPIVGKRFKCKDCLEAIGFDLCGKCHESGCVVGRFNQRHTPEHIMEEVRLPSRGSIARQFLNAISNRNLSITDRRIIADDCNEAETLRALPHPIGGYSESPEGISASVVESTNPEQVATGDGDGDGLLEDVTEDGVQQVDHTQDVDENHHIFMHNDGEDEEFGGEDDEEFETFSRDDEDIQFYRVVFHS